MIICRTRLLLYMFGKCNIFMISSSKRNILTTPLLLSIIDKYNIFMILSFSRRNIWYGNICNSSKYSMILLHIGRDIFLAEWWMMEKFQCPEERHVRRKRRNHGYPSYPIDLLFWRLLNHKHTCIVPLFTDSLWHRTHFSFPQMSVSFTHISRILSMRRGDTYVIRMHHYSWC